MKRPAGGRPLFTEPSRLADANAELPDSVLVVLGVPFDETASFRRGAREGPAAIRSASYNFEEWLLELGLDIGDVPVHDAGDLEGLEGSRELVHRVELSVGELMGTSRIPVLLGGEHIATEGAIWPLSRRHPGLRVLVMDAHLDFRDEYMGDPRSHACTTRRLSDVVGVERVAVMGIRSMSAKELEDAQDTGLYFEPADRVREEGLEAVTEDLLASLGEGPLYLSIDLDVLDPSHAPGVQNPEPWGLAPLDVRHVIDRVAPRLVGLDVMECAPAYDGGQTAAVAARLLRHAVGAVWLARDSHPLLSSR